MTDNNALPYVDLAFDAEALRQYTKDNFGKKIASNAKPETVVDRFREIYKEETGITLADIGPDIDPEEEESAAVEQETDKAPKPIAVTINVQDDEKDPQPIVGSVQFVPYRIVRNVDVRVSIPILVSLQNAMKTVYNPKTMEAKDVPMYPFSIVEYHFK